MRRLPFTFCVAVTVALIGLRASAQIRTDGTLGPQQNLGGPHTRIPHTLGQTRGTNLFHSFSEFSIPKRGSATFTGPGTVTNVLARVTGNNVSRIGGALVCTIPDANLYIINPAGVIFGENASLRLEGSFTASSASVVILGNAGRFNASRLGGSVLTSASPAAFGFLPKKAAANIEVRGKASLNSINDPSDPIRRYAPELGVAQGKTIAFVGGDIHLTGAALRAPGGQIRLSATQTPGTRGNYGQLTLTDSLLNTFGGAHAGRVRIAAAGPVSLLGSASAIENGGTVFVKAGGDISLSATVARISAFGGRVTVYSGRDIALTSAMTASITADSGGQIAIKAKRDVIVSGNGGSPLLALQGFSASGQAGGQINVAAGRDVRIVGERAGVFALGGFGFVEAFGPGGQVAITALRDIVLTGFDASISADGTEPGGKVSLRAERNITLSGDSSSVSARRGEVKIVTVSGDLTLSGRFSNVNADGNDTPVGAEVGIRTGGNVTLSGLLSRISADPFVDGAAGRVSVRAVGSVTLANGATISASNAGGGTGASVTIHATQLRITEDSSNGAAGTGIRAESTAGVIGGRADLVLSINARPSTPSPTLFDLSLRSPAGTSVAVGSVGRGVAEFQDSAEDSLFDPSSPITPFAAFVGQSRLGLWTLEVVDAGDEFASSISNADTVLSSVALSVGRDRFEVPGEFRVPTGGRARIPIRVTSPGLVAGNPGLSIGGSAGTIDVLVDQLVMKGPGTISTASLGSGRGGAIAVHARDSVFLSRGAIIQSRAGGADVAGNLKIIAGEALTLRDATLTTEASGIGGNLAIDVGGAFTARGSTLTARAGRLGDPSAQVRIRSGTVIGLDDSIINGLITGVSLSRAQGSSRDVPVIISAPTFFITNSSILSDSRTTPSPALDVTASTTSLRISLTTPPVLADLCEMRIGSADISTFTIGGAEGIAITPGDFAPSFDLSTTTKSARDTKR